MTDIKGFASIRQIAILLMWFGLQVVWSQPLCTVTKYNEANGVSSSHVTQLLQDNQGFMWFSTWNGLCRYDGYEFQTFKPAVGDGCHMATDRIRDINLLPDGQILCRVDEDYFMFDLHTYRFRDLTNAESQHVEEWTKKHRQTQSMLNGRSMTWTDSFQTQWILYSDGRLTYRQSSAGQETNYPLPLSMGTLSFAMADHQGHLWVLDQSNIYKICTDMQHTHRLAIEPKAEVKCMFADRQGRYWVATKDDKVVRIYQNDNRLAGYLGSDGNIHPNYTPFGASVYCIYEAKDGVIWLGTKPDGLFRLRPMAGGSFEIDHFTDLPSPDVYHIAADKYGRLWVAMLGGGICYTVVPNSEVPHFIVPKRFPKNDGQRVRYIYITKDDIMLAASGNGLWVARLEKDADNMLFHFHQRDSKHAGSLSCSATMDVVEDQKGRLFVSTESGGINQIMSKNLLGDTLVFRHFNDFLHTQGRDVVQSLTLLDDCYLMAVGSHLLTLTDSNFHGRVLDASYLQGDYRFSEAHPLQLSKNRWLFGLTDGALITTIQRMTTSTTMPRLVLTSVSVQGGSSDYSVEMADSIVLSSHERSLTVRFAALDYNSAELISYAFRLSTDKQWHYIGHDRSATLLDMKPGTYQLEIRSTNADGEWQENVRSIIIVVTPTFWQSLCGRLLIALFIISFITVIVYTLLYIRRIKRQQRETLEKYLALIQSTVPSPQSSELDPVIERVMTFIDEHLSDSDIGVGDMAAASATSRSGLQRKLKQAMGITPLDLLREARIKRACQLLRSTDKPISEVAYACGFSDPKYFSRSFKQSTGQSPTDYKNAT